METNRPNASWPYWHVDAKWILGLSLLLVLQITLLLFTFYRLTERETAIHLSSTVIAVLFSREGLDEAKSVADTKRLADQTPGETIQVPNLPISIPKSDLETLSPRELRLSIFRRLVEPLYDSGPKEAAKQLTADPTQQNKFAKDAFLFQLLTKETHQKIGLAATIALILTIILVIPFILVSHGYGRLGNIGFILCASSFLGTALFLILQALRYGRHPIASGGEGIGNRIAQEVLPVMPSIIGWVYLPPMILGLILLLAAKIAKIVSRRKEKEAR